MTGRGRACGRRRVVGGGGAWCGSSGPAEPGREAAVPAFLPHRPGGRRPRCPTSRTRAREPTAGALETPHLTEDLVPSPPREQASMEQPSPSGPPSPPPIHLGRMMAASRSPHFSPGPYLTSFGSRPVSLRIFSSTFFRLSLAFSSCSCKVLTATAIFSLLQASRLLLRPRRAVSRRQTRED